jgi:hypothetical protein
MERHAPTSPEWSETTRNRLRTMSFVTTSAERRLGSEELER